MNDRLPSRSIATEGEPRGPKTTVGGPSWNPDEDESPRFTAADAQALRFGPLRKQERFTKAFPGHLVIGPHANPDAVLAYTLKRLPKNVRWEPADGV